mgnify:FL=1
MRAKSSIFTAAFVALLLLPGIASSDQRTDKLKQLAPGMTMGEPEETPIAGLYQVKIGNNYAYVTEDGDFVLVGNLIDLKAGTNLTRKAQGKDNLEHLATFPEKDMVIFPADGEIKATITVFSDTTCQFCRQLHAEVPVLQKAGVSVRYIAYPREGLRGPGYESLKSVWCASDRREAMNIAKRLSKGSLPAGNCIESRAVAAGFEFGNKLGKEGTPTIYLPDGQKLGGYLPVKQLLKSLGLNE